MFASIMPRSYLDPPMPITALATPLGRSALAVIRAGGPGAIDLASRCFSRPGALRKASGGRFLVGAFLDASSKEIIDEAVVSIFRAPKSPTGEDLVEFSFHGSQAVIRRALEVLIAAGFAPALPGEFSFRAFLSGKTDLIEAEAIDEIARAGTEGARAEALRRLEGGLSHRIVHARGELLELLAEAEVRLDYAEEDGAPSDAVPPAALNRVRDSLAALAATYRTGRLYRDGLRAVLSGRPNAGKSSLFNLLLREERSIVSPEPGTTRDWIEAAVELGGVELRLIDTAGLREAREAVEAEGVERSRRLLAEADIAIHLVDARIGLSGEDQAIFDSIPAAIRVWNKVDAADARPVPAGFLGLSASTGEGFPAFAASLESRITELLGREERKPESAGGEARAIRTEALVASERQKALLDRAVRALESAASAAESGAGLDAVSVDLRDAADALGEITGEISSPEILEAIFSRFCLGK